MNEIIPQKGIDWALFLWHGLQVVFVAVVLSLVVLPVAQWAVFALGFVDIVTYMQVFWCVLAVVLFVWLIVVATYKHWEHRIK